MKLGLYIHIPFCRNKCPYCAFVRVNYENLIAEKYLTILTQEVNGLREKFKGNINTIYIGGGTPSALSLAQFRYLIEKIIYPIVRSSSVEEVTIEVNPESFDLDKAIILSDYGINRVSIGAQSFNGEKLKRLGRIHQVKQIYKTIEILYSRQIKNINLDLIFAVPGEDMSQWEKDLSKAVKLPITHISCYGLTYEEKTEFYNLANNFNEKQWADMYLLTMDFLPSKGFFQYEVSNYSLPGYECKHNLKYWQEEDYLGLGPSAVSFLANWRRKRIEDIESYIEMVICGKECYEQEEYIIGEKFAREYASLKIRTKEGIDFSLFKQRTGIDFFEIVDEQVLDKYVSLGWVIYKEAKQGICLSRQGFLFADELSSEFSG